MINYTGNIIKPDALLMQIIHETRIGFSLKLDIRCAVVSVTFEPHDSFRSLAEFFYLRQVTN